MKKIYIVLFLAALATAPLFTTGCAVTSGRQGMGEYASDRTITTKVNTALLADPDVKGIQVDVTTFQGTVQLSGFVETQAQKDRAGDIARRTSGVVDVRNDLIVQTGRNR